MNTDFHLSQKLDAVHSLGCWQSVQSLAPMGQPDKAVQAHLSSSLSLKNRAEGSGFPQRPLGVISPFDGLVIATRETVRPAGTQTKSSFLAA